MFSKKYRQVLSRASVAHLLGRRPIQVKELSSKKQCFARSIKRKETTAFKFYQNWTTLHGAEATMDDAETFLFGHLVVLNSHSAGWLQGFDT